VFHSLELNKKVSVTVVSSKRLTYLSYQILGRGNILLSRTTRIANKRTANIQFWLTFPMIPESTMIVYYILSSGEIVSDVVQLNFAQSLMNNVSIIRSGENWPYNDVGLFPRKPFEVFRS
jgi:CD109 antigen